MSTAGRSNQQSTVKQAGQDVTTGQGLENQGQNIASSEINTSGGLSPLVSRQLANNEGQIQKSYASAAQGAQRGLAQRGMSAAPSGLQASITNSAVNNAGQAKTGAIGNAFGTQNELNQTALNPAISALGATTGATNAATGANQALAAMPTTAGNIFSGLQGLGNLGMTGAKIATSLQGSGSS
jgi:hypothetical protein